MKRTLIAAAAVLAASSSFATQTEGSVRNRADGSAFWLKAVFPF
jgi:hypothetical protein